MVNFTFLFLTLLSFQAHAQNICSSYEWPNSIKNILKLNGEMKQKALGEEIDEFSRKVGTCYERDPVGLAEKTWCSVKRDENIEKIFKEFWFNQKNDKDLKKDGYNQTQYKILEKEIYFNIMLNNKNFSCQRIKVEILNNE